MSFLLARRFDVSNTINSRYSSTVKEQVIAPEGKNTTIYSKNSSYLVMKIFLVVIAP
jgi:hypothetical protein